MTIVINRYNSAVDEVIKNVESIDFLCAGPTGQKLQIYALQNGRNPVVIERFIGLGDYCSVIKVTRKYSTI